MPSHLTRVVFRSLIANKPLIYRGCLRSIRPRIHIQHGPRAISLSQRRTFFQKLFKQERRKIKDADIPPGMDPMMQLAMDKRQKTRPPPVGEIVDAFNLFFKKKGDQTATDAQVLAAILSFNYIQESPAPTRKHWLSMEDLRSPFRCLQNIPKGNGAQHLHLGRLLYDEIKRRTVELEPEVSTKVEGQESMVEDLAAADTVAFIKLLCLCGASKEAHDLVKKDFTGPGADPELCKEAWLYIIKGFAKEGDPGNELKWSIDSPFKSSLPFTPDMQEVLVSYFAASGNLDQAKDWYREPLSGSSSASPKPSPHAQMALLKACALYKDWGFGQKVVTSLLERFPDKGGWDALFLWSAANGKGVDEVDRMMTVMIRRGEEAGIQIRPDIDTINTLVEFAMSRKDSYAAERYITLGEKWNIQPNAKTFVMQMNYRLSANDIDGARTAYFGLQGEKIEGDESIDAVNRLIQAMCKAKRHHFDDIMGVVDDLQEIKGRFTASTVAALCLLHLHRSEFVDAMDLLQNHAYHFSLKERQLVSDKFYLFCTNRENSTADAWDTYNILRVFFSEVKRDTRTKLMNEFFGRGRSDMACHVFFHMRNSYHTDIKPTKDTYVDVFVGFGRQADAESLELVHNQLRLDMDVELDTKLRNALMIAYAGTKNHMKALDIWKDIMASAEGPTYSSIAIAFRACEGMTYGDQNAAAIWAKLLAMDIEITKEIFVAFLGPLSRCSQFDVARNFVEAGEEKYGFKPDLQTIANWYNAAFSIRNQERIEEWAKEHCSGVWREVETLGFIRLGDGNNLKRIKFSRLLDP